MKNLSLFIFFLFSSLVYAGSNDATITGITSSKRTKVEISVGDVTGLIRKVNLTVDGKSYILTPKNSTVFKDDENGVYVLIAESNDYHFKMWMIPGSEKIVSKTSSSLKTTFAAVIEATDPRKGDKWKMTPRITIGCKLDYSI